MRSIKITKELKEKNKRYGTSFIENNPVGKIVKTNLPSRFYSTVPVSGGYDSRTDLHDADGWQTPVIPAYDPVTEKLSVDLIEVGEDHTYKVIDKSPEEIQTEVRANSESMRQAKIVELQEKQIIDAAQAITDDKEALDNQVLFPMWTDFENEFLFPAQIMVNDFVGNELKLFRAIQPNNKRENTRPILYPAGWTLIEYSEDIELWSQPKGGDGKYPYLDEKTGKPYLVKHNDQIWQNDFKTGLNVWKPGEYGWIKYTG